MYGWPISWQHCLLGASSQASQTLWRDAACRKVDMELDAALVNNSFGVVSPFPCRGADAGVSVGGGGWPEFAVERLIMQCRTHSEQRERKNTSQMCWSGQLDFQ